MAQCTCPAGARRFSTKPKGAKAKEFVAKHGRAPKPRGSGFVCMEKADPAKAKRFVKKKKDGTCPAGSRAKSNKRGATVCMGTVASLRAAGRRNVKDGWKIVSQVCPGGRKTRRPKRATPRRRAARTSARIRMR